MDARLYLVLARDLVEKVRTSQHLAGTAGQAECRTAISRAYYAVLHLALEILDFLEIAVTDSGQCHVVVQYALNNSGDSTLVAIGSQLRTLHNERKYADYKMLNSRPESLTYADALVRLADQTSAQLAQRRRDLHADAAKMSEVRAAILDWAKNAQQHRNLWKK
jgi:hypothetical protein